MDSSGNQSTMSLRHEPNVVGLAPDLALLPVHNGALSRSVVDLDRYPVEEVGSTIDAVHRCPNPEIGVGELGH